MIARGLRVAAATALCVAVAPASARAEATICVGLVIDYGTSPDAPRGPSDECVELAPESSGAEALKAHGLRWSNSGLLCAIDSYPTSGCGERTADGVSYWSYWRGGAGGWAYFNQGPAQHEVDDGDVLGWRFQVDVNESDAAPPRGPTSFHALCPEASPTRSPTRPATIAPTPSAPAATASTRSPSGGSVSPRNATSPVATAGPTAPTPNGDRSPSLASNGDRSPSLASERDRSQPAGAGDGLPVGVLAGGALVLALGFAAAYRARRGPG